MQDDSNEKGHDLVASAKARLDELQDTAKALSDEHWMSLKQANRGKEFADKSRLFPRVAKAKHSFRIEWYYIQKWYKNFKGQWKKVTRYIALGKGYRYKLNRYAQEWEVESLNEFEDRASAIRREAEILDNFVKSYERFLTTADTVDLCQIEDAEVHVVDVDGAD